MCFSFIHYDYRVIPESFKWLVTKGRYTDAEMVINKIARINDRDAPNTRVVRKVLGLCRYLKK